MYPERRTAWIIRGYLLDGEIDAEPLADALSRLGQRHWYLSCAIDTDGKMHPRDTAIPLGRDSSRFDWSSASCFESMFSRASGKRPW